MEFKSVGYNEERKEKASEYQYHHSRPLETVSFGIIKPVRLSTLGLEGEELDDIKLWSDSFLWLEEKVGYYPLFLSVGQDMNALRATNHTMQWKKDSGKFGRNRVLFSFAEKPAGTIFMDSDAWNINVLNKAWRGEPSKAEIEELFRPGWSEKDWLKYLENEENSAEIVVPQLDLSKASEVLVRNNQTKARLLEMGFKNVVVKRMSAFPNLD